MYLQVQSSKHCITGLRSAAVLWTSLPPTPGRCQGRRAEGLRFERKVQNALEQRYSNFCPPVPIFYSDAVNPQWVGIPEGFFFQADRPEPCVVALEIKLRHSSAAWTELKGLYVPVLRKAFGLPVRSLEVVKYFEPREKCPAPVVELDEFLRGDGDGVVCWEI